MTLKFKSKISNPGQEDQDIEFKAKVEVSDYEQFKAFEFIEPSQGVMNRIEVSDNAVNIFAGPSTINLVLGQTVINEYHTPQGAIYFQSKLISLVSDPVRYTFMYKLSQADSLFGTFEIELTLEK